MAMTMPPAQGHASAMHSPIATHEATDRARTASGTREPPRHPPPPVCPAPSADRDLLLYRLSAVLAGAGGIVIRQCEGRFGITRREWRLLAC